VLGCGIRSRRGKSKKGEEAASAKRKKRNKSKRLNKKTRTQRKERKAEWKRFAPNTKLNPNQDKLT
jgi:hypothetical protein